jgi:hypothetical protein
LGVFAVEGDAAHANQASQRWKKTAIRAAGVHPVSPHSILYVHLHADVLPQLRRRSDGDRLSEIVALTVLRRLATSVTSLLGPALRRWREQFADTSCTCTLNVTKVCIWGARIKKN